MQNMLAQTKVKTKTTFLTIVLLLMPLLTMAQYYTAEEWEKHQAEQQKIIGYVALGVVITIGLIIAVWLLVIKKEKDGKIKVKTYSPKDTYRKGSSGGDGFIGGFRDGWDN